RLASPRRTGRLRSSWRGDLSCGRLGHRRGPLLLPDHDVREELVLLEVDDDAAVQVEQRDERYDSPSERGRRTEQLAERDLAALVHDEVELAAVGLARIP